jgi:cobalamin synthase
MAGKKIIDKRKVFYALFAAVAYLVVTIVFLNNPIFAQTWLLYVGNVLFGIIVAIYLFTYNNKANERASAYSMVKAGHIVTAMGILVSVVVIAFIVLFWKEHFANTPPQIRPEQNHGLVFILFLDAIVGNASAGAFVAIIFPFALTKMQKGGAEPSGDLK